MPGYFRAVPASRDFGPGKLPTMSSCQKIAAIVLLLTCGMVWPQQAGSTGNCLQYAPSVVKLTGTLIRRTFPGPPNYESVRKGDRAETSWFLDLSRPVCVDEDKADNLSLAQNNVGRIQLAVSFEDFKKYQGLVGKRVVRPARSSGSIRAITTRRYCSPSRPWRGRIELLEGRTSYSLAQVKP